MKPQTRQVRALSENKLLWSAKIPSAIDKINKIAQPNTAFGIQGGKFPVHGEFLIL